jgi:hypothetical protein
MRFSIRSLLVLTAIAAFFSGLLFGLPDGFAILGLVVVSLLIPTALVAAIVYARGYGQAFAIGALIPSAWIILFAAYLLPMGLLSGFATATDWGSDLGIGIESMMQFKIAFVMEFVLAALSGGVAMAVRRLCVGPKRSSAVEVSLRRQLTETIDPRNKAELYKIIERRLNPLGTPKGDGLIPEKHQ